MIPTMAEGGFDHLGHGAGMLLIAIGWGGSDPSFRSPLAVIGA